MTHGTLGVIAGQAWRSTLRTALVALLGFWTLSALILPRLAPGAAEAIAQTPTLPTFQASVREEIARRPTGHDPNDARLEAFKQETLRRYGVSTVEELPISWAGLSLQMGEQFSTEVYRLHFAALRDIYEQQAIVTRALTIVSPTLAIKPWSAALAGTDQVRSVVPAADVTATELEALYLEEVAA